jgi:hypothetical protein
MVVYDEPQFTDRRCFHHGIEGCAIVVVHPIEIEYCRHFPRLRAAGEGNIPGQ